MAYDPRAHKRRRVLAERGIPALIKDPALVEYCRSYVRSLHGRGMSYKQMARQAGYTDLHHFANFVHADTKSIRRTKYVQLMALRFEPPFESEHGAQVPLTGVRRRLQALQVDGFPLEWLADRLPIQVRHVGRLARGEIEQHTHYYIAAAVSDLYAKLEQADPLDLGISRTASLKTTSWAKKRKYAPRKCWDPDTIDDPEAFPEYTGVCGTISGPGVHKREKIPLCRACLQVKYDQRDALMERRKREQAVQGLPGGVGEAGDPPSEDPAPAG